MMLGRALLPFRSRMNMQVHKDLCKRCASGRGHYVKDGSNKKDMSEETKDLLRQAKNPDEQVWKLGPGILEPSTMDLSTEERTRARQYQVDYYGRASVADDDDNKVTYYPNDEEDMNVTPSPVLMVRKIKKLMNEPYWNKHYCEQIGLGRWEKMDKLSFLPNLPSVGLLLHKIKHLVEITPVTFPNGIPEEFDPDKDGSHLSPNGEFVVNQSYKVDLDEIAGRAEWMKLDQSQIKIEANRHWRKPWNSPLGNSNYHQDNRWFDNDAAEPENVKNAKKKY